MREERNVVAIYSRKSKFTGKGDSVANQVEMCRDFVRQTMGPDVPLEVFEDEGFSGANLNRPGFKKMMEGVRQRRFQAVVVYKLDRISRSVGDFDDLLDELKRFDTAFVSVRDQFDTKSVTGRTMMYMLSVFAQFERDTIAERIRDNMHELAKTGRWLGGTTPTGYASEPVEQVTVDGKSRKSYRLTLVPEEAATVRTMFDLYLSLDSLTKVEAELINRGIRTKNGRMFTRFSIKGILQNPVYAVADGDAYHYFARNRADLHSGFDEFDGTHGVMAYNRTEQTKGRASKTNPMELWIVAVGRHPGLVSGRDWVQVQESLDRNKSKAYHKPRQNEALLTGQLYCTCGSRMYPRVGPHKTPEGKARFSYLCKLKQRSKGGACCQKNADGLALDLAVIDQLKRLEQQPELFEKQLEQSRRFYTGQRQTHQQQLETLRREQEQTRRKVNGLVDSLADVGESSARGAVLRRIEELNRELTAGQLRIREMESLTEMQTLSEQEFDLLREQLSSFRRSVDAMTVEQQRAAIAMLVRKVIWDGTCAHVVLFGVQDEEFLCPPLPVNGEETAADEGTAPRPAAESAADAGQGAGAALPSAAPCAPVLSDWGEESK